MFKDIKRVGRCFTFIFIGFLGSLVLSLNHPTASPGQDCWIQKPLGWTDNNPDSAGELIRQFIEPEQNAFIEIYSRVRRNPGLRLIADGWERNASAKGLPYVQERLSSLKITLHPAAGIIREYQGTNNKVPIGAVALYTYHKGRVYVVLGVWTKSSPFEDLVKRTVRGFRLSPPEQQRPVLTDADCETVIGRWKWYTGNNRHFRSNGTIDDSPRHTWQCDDPSRRIFTVRWNNGQWIDTLALSPDGNRLEGENQLGHRVWATRLHTPKTGPPAPSAAENTSSPPPVKGAQTADAEGDGVRDARTWQWAFHPDFNLWLRTPVSWNIRGDIQDGHLDLIINAPDENASVQLKANDIGREISPDELADVWEDQAEQQGYRYLAHRKERSRINIVNTGIPESPMTFHEYAGNKDGVAIGSYVGYATRGNMAYVLMGLFPSGDDARERVVRQCLLGFRLARPGENQINATAGIYTIRKDNDSSKTPASSNDP
jgi:hypothetical protein